MKKEDIPQDKSHLESMTPELYYVKNSNGSYDTALSTGWKVKNEALDDAWEMVHERVEIARNAVENGLKSPIYYHMVKNLMTLSILSSYVNIARIRVWMHMRPSVYKKLSARILFRYAKVFNIRPEELNILT
jgi:hypothetical protein